MRRVELPRIWGLSFNLTPMIDVIFQLIIFYLCVSQFVKAETIAGVTLPTAREKTRADPQEDPARLVINVFADGTLLLTTQRIELAELPGVLQHRKAAVAPAALEVWIRADRAVPYHIIDPLLAACAKQGIWKVSFKVKPVDERARADSTAQPAGQKLPTADSRSRGASAP